MVAGKLRWLWLAGRQAGRPRHLPVATHIYRCTCTLPRPPPPPPCRLCAANTIASSFGKVINKEQGLEGYNPADVAMSLCRMISYNIGQLAYLNAKRCGGRGGAVPSGMGSAILLSTAGAFPLPSPPTPSALAGTT